MSTASYKPAAGEALSIVESGGPTTLPIGAIADGQFLKRVGATIVGAAGGGGGIDGTMVLGRIPVGFDADTLQTYAGLTFDGTHFVAALGAIGAGTNGFTVTGTVAAASLGANFSYTSTAGTNSYEQGFYTELLAGYNGTGDTYSHSANNFAESTGTTAISGFLANFGMFGQALGITSGDNVGVAGYGRRSTGRNYGVLGLAPVASNGATNIGAAGFGRNTGTTPIQIGGYFSLGATEPTYVSAALIADNADQTSPIQLWRNNGVVVWTIGDDNALAAADGSNVVFGTTTGTQLGTATSQKLAFYGSTPIVQGASVADATDAASAITQLNALISRIEAVGLIATV